MRRSKLAVIVQLGFAASQVTANIVSTINTTVDTIPASLTIDSKEAANAFVFAEQQNVTLSSALAVDLLVPFDYTFGDPVPGGTIAAGTTVNSYLIHFDPIGTPSALQTTTGSVTFSERILAVYVRGISFLDFVATTEPVEILGIAGTTYPVFFPGLETGDETSVLIVSPNTIDFTLFANGVNEIRVVTAAVPAPASAMLVFLGLGHVAWLKRRLA